MGLLTGVKSLSGLYEGMLPGVLMVYDSTPDDVRGVGGVTVHLFLGDTGTSEPDEIIRL